MPPPAILLPQFRGPCAGQGLVWAPLDGPAVLVNRCESGGRIDAMIVLAGIVPGREDADIADDARIADACLAAAHAAGIPRCLVASSSAIYGRGTGVQLREDAPLRPVTAYGRAKLETESACSRWRGRGLAVTALRIGNVAGADSLLAQDAIRMGHEVILDRFSAGGGPVRSYIDPMTLADVLATLSATEGLPPVLNVAAPGGVAMADLLDAAGLPWRWRPAPATALECLILDCARLASLHRFPADTASPAGMVAAWRQVVT